MAREKYTPFFLQLIHWVKKGFLQLDETSQKEIRLFIESQQHVSGGFTDRGGNPDLYYSLFGLWVSAALNMDESLEKLTKFIHRKEKKEKAGIDFFTSFLIRSFLQENSFKKPSQLSLVQLFFRKGSSINTIYLVFLFLLTFDFFYGKRKPLLFLARVVLLFYRPPGDSPCSICSAYTVARVYSGINVKKQTRQLFSYFEKMKGFKIFQNAETADLLSTAVALFALRKGNADLRLVAPDCLHLIQQNYDTGAFLSGDGDNSRDLEYTFYGLLSLGILSEK